MSNEEITQAQKDIWNFWKLYRDKSSMADTELSEMMEQAEAILNHYGNADIVHDLLFSFMHEIDRRLTAHNIERLKERN